MTMSITLRVPLSPFIGYGNDGIGIASELVRYGVDVHLSPGSLIDAPIPAPVAHLLTKQKLPKYDLTIHHMDPDNLHNPDAGSGINGLTVAWTMWEFSNLHNAAGFETLAERMEPYDVLLAYDQNTAEAFSEVFSGKILVLQGGFMPHDYPYIERDWFDEDHFRFCMVGQLHDRKDPFVSIQAFSELKDEYPEEFASAELHLKNSMPGALDDVLNRVYKDKKIRVYNEIWGKDVLDQFYSQMHVLLAPSRGEGKNMPALEFQSTGGVVIATNWGGHTGWLNSAYAYPLDYTLHPIDDVYEQLRPDTLNARASVEHMKELMLHVFRNRSEAKQKGELASNVIPKTHSWEAVIEKMFFLLGEEDPKIGALAAAARIEASRDDD